jgi:hypothetical protein
MNDHPDLVRQEHHHVAGPCDLPTAPFDPADLSPRTHRCRVFLDWNRVRLCSCDLCSWGPWRRRQERARRTAERAWARAAAAGADEVELEAL